MFDDAAPVPATPTAAASRVIHRAGAAEQMQRIEEQIRTLERHAAAALRPNAASAPVAQARRPLASLSPAQLLALGFIAEGAGDFPADDPLPAALSGLGLVECSGGAWRLTGLGRSLLRPQG